MQKSFSIAEAKNQLPGLIHRAEKESYIKLTRRGKPVAVLMSIQEYERLSCKHAGFWNELSQFRKKIHDEGIEISDSDFEGLREVETGREVDLVE